MQTQPPGSLDAAQTGVQLFQKGSQRWGAGFGAADVAPQPGRWTVQVLCAEEEAEEFRCRQLRPPTPPRLQVIR